MHHYMYIFSIISEIYIYTARWNQYSDSLKCVFEQICTLRHISGNLHIFSSVRNFRCWTASIAATAARRILPAFSMASISADSWPISLWWQSSNQQGWSRLIKADHSLLMDFCFFSCFYKSSIGFTSGD